MIWAIVWVEQFENFELLSMQFQPYGPSKKVLIWPKEGHNYRRDKVSFWSLV